ncbi:MAG: hypothetical protein AAF629_19635 [Chloroflexota bacterium]
MDELQIELNEVGELIGVSATAYYIFLPLQDNDKRPFANELIEQLHDEITSRVGGATCTFGKGVWVDEGKVYEDPVSVIQTSTTDPTVATFLAEWAVKTARLLDQVDHSIYILSQEVYIRQPSSESVPFVQPELPLVVEEPLAANQGYYAPNI